MKLEDLRNALTKQQPLSIRNGEVCIGQESLNEKFPAEILDPFYGALGIEIDNAEPDRGDPNKLVIEGNASLPSLPSLKDPIGGVAYPLLTAPTEVQATLELAGAKETLRVTLRYKLPELPKLWQFADSFPGLPLPFDYRNQHYDYGSNKSALDATFSLTGRKQYLYLTTHEHEHKLEDGGSVILKRGLNFVGRCAPGGMLGLFAHLASSQGDTLLLHGQVVPGSTVLPAFVPDQLPWDASPRSPGIYLEAPLGSGPSFWTGSDAIQFTNLRFQFYSPLSQYWLLNEPTCQPAMAYLGDLVIPAIRETRLLTVSAKVSPGLEDELVFACRFVDFDIENLVKAFKTLNGGKDLESFIPDKIKANIAKLGPQSASITLARPNPRDAYEVACTQLTVGMGEGAKPLELFDGLIKIGFNSARFAVVNPFDNQRLMSATLRGGVEFLGVALDIKFEVPNLYFSAEQVGIATFPVQDYLSEACRQLGLEKSTLPWPAFLPPSVEIANMSLEADFSSYYAFSMSLATSYKIGGYSLPTLRLAITCNTHGGKSSWGWQFEAGTEKPVPIFQLIKHLASEVADFQIPIEKLPSAIQGLAIKKLALSYHSKTQDFAFEGWGTLPLNGVDLECCFTIEKKHAPSKTLFGGQILLRPEGQAPLSFSLMFGAEDNSKYCLAAYNDEYGYELKIRSLAKKVFGREEEDPKAPPSPPDLSDRIPASLSMTLNSALLAYYSGSATDSKAETEGTSGSEAKSAVLFGVDLGAKVKLSDLPVVGSAMPKDQAIGFESLRIILASEAIAQSAVDSFDTLLAKTGAKPLSELSGKGDGKGGLGLEKGCNVTADLLFGPLSRTLSLPVAEGIKESPQQPTTGGNGATTASASVVGSTAAAPAPARAPAQAEAATKWFEVDKSLGPVTVRRVGLAYDKGRVGIKFDASLQLNVLTFSIDGLGMTYPLDKFTEPSQFLKHVEFTLDGMGLALGNGPIEIGGSLLRVPPQLERVLELEGTLLVRAASFSFSAFGSYIELKDKTTSLMAFGVLLAELGDPTGTGAFLITGLAFGFGVNRTLTLPSIEGVEKYPLVQAAMGEDSFAARQKLPEELREYVSPAVGNFWIAAGIKFNSFGIVDSFLLVSVSWGAEIEIGLLGLSRMSAPTRVTPDKTIACAELALRGVIRIAEGLIQFEARLTANSFIFSKDCRLTGGFAFCLWFKGPHAGDFVISLGGYHPAFLRPGHYPLVPRVGMQLQIAPSPGSELSITGEAYFALTPSCIMVGGKLCAVFKSGGIEAWFIAYADFLMNWQPFYYQAVMSISLGIALRLGAIAIRLDVGVELRLQGPPFGGEALVKLWIISFTIPFGAPASPPKPLDAAQFISKCLPAPRSIPGASPASQTSSQPDVFSLRITGGLLREQEVEASNGKKVTEGTPKEVEKRTYRIVKAHQLSLAIQSVIPCTEFDGLAKELKSIKVTNPKTRKEEEPCGIRPMGKPTLVSVFSVTADGIVPGDKVKLSAITSNVPDALWGKSEQKGLVLPTTPENKTIPATVGVRIDCIPQAPQDSLDIPIAELKDSAIPAKHVDWAVLEPPEYKQTAKRWTDYKEISSKSVAKTRNAVLECLRKQLPADWVLNEPNLEVLSETKDYFQQQPELNAVGY